MTSLEKHLVFVGMKEYMTLPLPASTEVHCEFSFLKILFLNCYLDFIYWFLAVHSNMPLHLVGALMFQEAQPILKHIANQCEFHWILSSSGSICNIRLMSMKVKTTQIVKTISHSLFYAL